MSGTFEPIARQRGPNGEVSRLQPAPSSTHSGGTALADQQRWLYRAITESGAADTCLDGRVRGGTLTPERRVEIYRHAYLRRLIECLRDDFPAVEGALGVEVFEGLCREYILRHPPQSVSLNVYGERFPHFLRAMAGDTRVIVPEWVAEVAVLEWATVRAIHADTAEVLSRAAFDRVPSDRWGELRLRLSPSVQTFELGYAVNGYLTDLRHARAAGVRVEPPVARTSWVLVCRSAEDVWRLDLAAWAYQLLDAFRRGCTLSEAFEGMGESVATPAAGAVSRCFQEWVASGAFSAGVDVTLRRKG